MVGSNKYVPQSLMMIAIGICIYMIHVIYKKNSLWNAQIWENILDI
jgi:hypothetical protein